MINQIRDEVSRHQITVSCWRATDRSSRSGLDPDRRRRSHPGRRPGRRHAHRRDPFGTAKPTTTPRSSCAARTRPSTGRSPLDRRPSGAAVGTSAGPCRSSSSYARVGAPLARAPVPLDRPAPRPAGPAHDRARRPGAAVAGAAAPRPDRARSGSSPIGLTTRCALASTHRIALQRQVDGRRSVFCLQWLLHRRSRLTI